MKRFLAVLMLVVMMCGCVGLAEEGKTFDPSVLEGKDGYSYDKFEKRGNISKQMVRRMKIILVLLCYWRCRAKKRDTNFESVIPFAEKHRCE